ncbi:hypothetical protein LTR53_014497, partial [Teratosphaeriaceae sp. CCFEE 6253]
DLPAYQEESDGPLLSPVMAPPVAMGGPVQQSAVQRDNRVAVEADRPAPKPADGLPAEPPPGYEEVQMQGLQQEAERRASVQR